MIQPLQVRTWVKARPDGLVLQLTYFCSVTFNHDGTANVETRQERGSARISMRGGGVPVRQVRVRMRREGGGGGK